MTVFHRYRSLLPLLIIGCLACERDAADEPATEALPAAGTMMPQPAAPASTEEARTVLMADSSAEHGLYLTAQNGQALYLLESDAQGKSTCDAECAAVWPPYVALQGSPSAGNRNVQANLIGTIQRENGAVQVTYGGHPLYFYSKDTGAGARTGQDVHDQWGEWYLVTPRGEPLKGH